MTKHTTCPECGCISSTVQHTEFHRDMVERIRTCDECPTQWTVSYGDPLVRDVRKGER